VKRAAGSGLRVPRAWSLAECGILRQVVALHIPKLMPDRTVQWVRVTISSGQVVCENVRRKVEQLKPLHGPSGSDPEPDWTLTEECRIFMAGRIVQKTRNGMTADPGPGVVM
jgi:hypothetical protein